jgi:hypothetical protein
MIPSHVSERLSLLADFRNELMSIYIQLRYCAEFVWPLAPEVLTLYSEFKAMGGALASISYPTEILLPNRRVSIGKWTARTKRYWKDEKKEQRWLAVPEYPQLAHIWENEKMDYWSKIVSILDYWWDAGPHRLEGISWVVETSVVKLTMRGKSLVDGIKPVVIERVEREFWALDIQPGLIDIPTKALHAEILTAQFLAQQGNGLLATAANENRVSMQLHVPRADTGADAPESWPFPTEQAGRIVDEILYLIASGMQEGSQKLEQVVSEEIRRLLPMADGKTASDALGKLRKSLDSLQQVEQYLNDWLSDFPYVVEL